MLSARVSQELWPGFPKEIVRPKLPVVLPVIRHTDCGRPSLLLMEKAHWPH